MSSRRAASQDCRVQQVSTSETRLVEKLSSLASCHHSSRPHPVLGTVKKYRRLRPSAPVVWALTVGHRGAHCRHRRMRHTALTSNRAEFVLQECTNWRGDNNSSSRSYVAVLFLAFIKDVVLWSAVFHWREQPGRVKEYSLSDLQSTDASDCAVDSRVVLVRTNDCLHHFGRRTCRVGIKVHH